MDQRKLQHLYHRAGFGLRPQELISYQQQDRAWNIQNLFESSEQIHPLETGLGLNMSLREIKDLSPKERQEILKDQRKQLPSLNLSWINRMINSEGQLRERMTFFWHNHFACRLKTVHTAESYYNTLHKHALGNFGDLLKAVSKEAGMLRFLNNQQNRKGHPNENFAREVMELFTLGRDNGYTETDIQEAARAFTGWTALPNGEFIFRRRQHDFGKKTFLGKSGNFNGDNILDMLLEDRRTATYIVEKIYKYFVHEDLDKEYITVWSKDFYESNYAITPLLQNIFSSNHFYKDEHIGVKIKSPVDFLVNISRMLNLKMENEKGLLAMQHVLGQVLFQPPNVAGWVQGKAWIDSSSLMTRLSIPKAIIFSESIQREGKMSFSGQEDGIRNLGRQGKNLAATINWEPLIETLNSSTGEQGLNSLFSYFLQVESPFSTKDLLAWTANDNKELALQKSVALIMSCPEFQLG